MSVRVRNAICALSCAAVVMSPLQASAAPLPKRVYQCYKPASPWTYSGFNLTIVDKKNYEIVFDDDSTKSGKYRKGKGKKLFFTKGYLKKKGFKGKHYKNEQGTHQIDLIKKSNKKGKAAHSCV